MDLNTISSVARPKSRAELPVWTAGDAWLAGGTWLFSEPQVQLRRLIDLTDLKWPAIEVTDSALSIAATCTIAQLDALACPPEWLAAPLISQCCRAFLASFKIWKTATVGGNLCVDTRCNYYNQTFEWRKSIGFCMKKDGDICLVAPSSPRCWAVSSSDTGPMAMALEGLVTLAGPDGERELPVAALYRDDGIDYMAKLPSEVVTELRLPSIKGNQTAYVKLRRRGSIDFPIAGAAVALQMEGETVARCRIVLSAVASHPLEARAADEFLTGKTLDEETVRAAAEIAAKPAKPLDNADLTHFWRKRMVRVVVEQALIQAATSGGGSKVKLLGQSPD